MRTKSRTEESLLEMLMYSGVSSLPEPNDKEQVWARAIVKILRKMDTWTMLLHIMIFRME